MHGSLKMYEKPTKTKVKSMYYTAVSSQTVLATKL